MEPRSVTTMEECRDLLRTWREDNVRRSDDVIDLWEVLLQDSTSELGDEKWMVLEQVAVAAIDCYRPDIVENCLKDLTSNFAKGSLRVKRLIAMKAEMNEDWDRAIAMLDSILQEDDANSQARKRKIAVHRARGDHAKAISELNKYIREFMWDGEAWMELCDLYVVEQDYSKAAFCCEELILQNPNNHLYYQKYADIRYTQGGFEQVELAKTYYCHAVKLNPWNMRALYGLLLACTQLASSPKCTAQKKKDFNKTVVWTAKQISSKYESKLGAAGMTAAQGSGQVGGPLLPDGLLGQTAVAP